MTVLNVSNIVLVKCYKVDIADLEMSACKGSMKTVPEIIGKTHLSPLFLIIALPVTHNT